MPNKKEDLLIVGAGPAGLTASIYASRYGIKHLVVGDILGGQISQTHKICNYPGMDDMSGLDFIQKIAAHAKKYNENMAPVLVKNISKKDGFFRVEFFNQTEMEVKTVILATGTKRRELNLPGEKDFFGKGVSYCATCDGFFYRNKIVGVVGGSDSAAASAVYLGDIAKKVYIIYRGQELRAEPYWMNLIKKNSRIEIIYATNVLEIFGKEKIEKVKLDKEYKNKAELFLDGLFIEAGSVAGLTCAENLKMETDENGYIKIGADGATSIPGIFAAGDITTGSNRFCQVITAAAEGAIAARAAFGYLKNQEK